MNPEAFTSRVSLWDRWFFPAVASGPAFGHQVPSRTQIFRNFFEILLPFHSDQRGLLCGCPSQNLLCFDPPCNMLDGCLNWQLYPAQKTFLLVLFRGKFVLRPMPGFLPMVVSAFHFIQDSVLCVQFIKRRFLSTVRMWVMLFTCTSNVFI